MIINRQTQLSIEVRKRRATDSFNRPFERVSSITVDLYLNLFTFIT